jgi:cytochrome c
MHRFAIPRTSLARAVTAGALCAAAGAAVALDADAAQALARKSDCFKCHTVDKKKNGPPYKEVAAKYKGKADAEQKLYVHLTTNPKVKVDGVEEEHSGLKTKNEAEVRNVVQWILSR